jgi:hypothetical protein
MRPDIAVCTAGRLNSSIDWERQHKDTIRIECLNADEPAKPASLQGSIAAFDDHLAASRDLFTMWVKDIPARPSADPALHQSLRRTQLARRQGIPQWRRDVACKYTGSTRDADGHRYSSRSSRRVLRPGATRQ